MLRFCVERMDRYGSLMMGSRVVKLVSKKSDNNMIFLQNVETHWFFRNIRNMIHLLVYALSLLLLDVNIIF